MMVMDKKYRDDLTLALRLHDLSSKQLDEVLAEVEAHVTETGENPEDAFGSARDYAAEVAGQLKTRTGKRSGLENLAVSIVVGVLVFAGVRYGLDGLDGDGGGIVITTVDLMGTIGFPVLLVVAGFFFYRAFKATSDRLMYFLAGLVTMLMCGFFSLVFYSFLTSSSDPAMFFLSNLQAELTGAGFLAAAAVAMVLAARRRGFAKPA